MELATVAKYELDIKVVVLVNDELGKITAEQQLAETHVWATSLRNPSFADMAESLGMFGTRVESLAALEAGMAHLFETPGPGLLEVAGSKLQY